MHPATHLLASWMIAESSPLERRDRTLVTLAGVVPDLDGLGAVAEIVTARTDSPLHWWSDYHHVLCHNLGFCLLFLLVAAALASKRMTTLFLSALAFHLHLLFDLVGARGPDGYQWPIPYLSPFSDRWQWTWDGQWFLNAWPNIALTVVFLLLTIHLAWRRKYSPVGLISPRADAVFVSTLLKWFGGSSTGEGP